MSSTDASIHRCTCGTWCYATRPCTTCNPAQTVHFEPSSGFVAPAMALDSFAPVNTT